MGKTILYRLSGIGGIPKKLRPILESEEIVVSDEGVRGWYITKDFKAPGKRYIHRREGFSGCLVVTRKRIVCYTYRKRQINISVDDPSLSALCVKLLEPDKISLSFEAAVFHKDQRGVIEFQFKTEKAPEFYDVMGAIVLRRNI
ncbi:MAG: hypothetical protein R6U89_11390 [Dehalococcoidia bacterium]